MNTLSTSYHAPNTIYPNTLSTSYSDTLSTSYPTHPQRQLP